MAVLYISYVSTVHYPERDLSVKSGDLACPNCTIFGWLLWKWQQPQIGLDQQADKGYQGIRRLY